MEDVPMRQFLQSVAILSAAVLCAATSAQAEPEINDGGVPPALHLAQPSEIYGRDGDRADATGRDPRVNVAAARLQQRDFAGAVAPLSVLADRGDSWAMVELAGLYAHGAGVARDEGRAMGLLRSAAALGHPEAALALGAALQRSNTDEARHWLTIASERGNELVRRDAARLLRAID
jgi:TPR repeat protein